MNEGNKKWLLAVAVIAAASLSFWLIAKYSNNNRVSFTIAQSYEDHLPDGSLIMVNGGSHIKYDPKFSGKNRLIELDGEAFFKAAPSNNRPFVVETDLGIIKTFSGEFYVKVSENDQLRVAVQAGTIQLTSSNDDNTILRKGQSAYYDKATRNLITKKESLDLFWVNKQLRFNKTPLKTVFKAIERNYNIPIMVIDSAILKCEYTGKIEKTSPDSVFNLLKLTHSNIEFIEKKDGYTVSGFCRKTKGN